MKAMVLKRIHNLNENQNPLELVDLPDPTPKEKEILVRVSACGICHTEWDEFLQLAAQMQIRPEVQEFRLEEANQALIGLKQNKIRGAKVLKIDS